MPPTFGFCRFVSKPFYKMGKGHNRGIRHFHISHNAPYLTPKFCIAFVFHFSWLLQSSLPMVPEGFFPVVCGENLTARPRSWRGGPKSPLALRASHPKRDWKQCLSKILGANKVYYEKCGSGEWLIMLLVEIHTWLRGLGAKKQKAQQYII